MMNRLGTGIRIENEAWVRLMKNSSRQDGNIAYKWWVVVIGQLFEIPAPWLMWDMNQVKYFCENSIASFRSHPCQFFFHFPGHDGACRIHRFRRNRRNITRGLKQHFSLKISFLRHPDPVMPSLNGFPPHRFTFFVVLRTLHNSVWNVNAD